MNWYVLYTKSRSEKKAEEQLLSMGINAYCPVYSKTKVWSDRKKKIYVPLLPSMVLININHKDINKVFECSKVVKYMFWLGKRAVVRQSEIDILKKYTNMDCNFKKIKALGVKIGDKYNLSLFNNEEGIVNRISNKNVWIYLKSIGYSVKLELA